MFLNLWAVTEKILLEYTIVYRYTIILSEADSGLVKLVVVTNIFFNNQQHEIKTKRFKYVKQIRSRFFRNNWSQRFYS